MKKIIAISLSVILCLMFVACGGGDTSNEETTAKEAPVVTTEAAKPAIEKSVDAVAAELGLTGGKETLYEYIGAIAGKEFNGGEVEIYQFEIGSKAYKEIEKSQTVSGVKVSAYNNGFALIFPNNEDGKVIKSFKDISLR